MDLISSRSNPKIKQLRQLREHRSHREDDPILVEGIFHVGELVAAAQAGKLGLESIYYAPEMLKSEFAQQLIAEQAADGLPCYPVAPEVFESISGKENPQGILALARPQVVGLSSLSPTNFPWGVGLVSPQDPGNLGTILRTIDAVGASGLLVLDSTLDAYHPSAVRASMGALFWHPVVRASFADFTKWVKDGGYTLYGTSAHGAEDYRKVRTYQRPCILLLGSEREGLSPEQQAVCDHVLKLPMGGRVTSLNLAVAAGVMLYEMLWGNILVQ